VIPLSSAVSREEFEQLQEEVERLQESIGVLSNSQLLDDVRAARTRREEGDVVSLEEAEEQLNEL
jgi:PHD/YefM family antitoxin component YafN of YafNO toxin-antitoxin module